MAAARYTALVTACGYATVVTGQWSRSQTASMSGQATRC